MNHISDWAKEWLVMINRTKYEATCYSLSPKREEFILQINGQEIHQQDTPTYLGVKLDTKLTWSPQISTMHSKGLRKMALMKKLAGTKWGANMKILTQVYTATVRPHMEYASSVWSSAAKTSLDQLTKTQNAGLQHPSDYHRGNSRDTDRQRTRYALLFLNYRLLKKIC